MRGLATLLLLAAPLGAQAQAAHFHHMHLNTTDPAAAIELLQDATPRPGPVED